MQEFTEDFQRAYIAACLSGMLGSKPSVLPASLFTQEREEIAREIRNFVGLYRLWPGKEVLLEKLPSHARDEALRIFQVTKDHKTYAADEGRKIVKRQALRDCCFAMADIIEDQPTDWDTLPGKVREALQTGEKTPDPFDYGKDMEARHRAENPVSGLLHAPTGMSLIDNAMGGGLASGELGLVMAPTKRGKSHMVTCFAVEALLKEIPVLSITLELRDKILARRYDRSISGMTTPEILENPGKMEKTIREKINDLSILRLVSAPRYTLTIDDVRELIDDALQFFGRRCAVVIDYGSILRRDQSMPKHDAIEMIHEELSTIAMEALLPIWTPYQTNKMAFMKGKNGQVDDLSLGHAGESYGSMKHADVIIVLNQSITEKAKGRMRVVMEGARDSAEISTTISYDWSRTRIKELK